MSFNVPTEFPTGGTAYEPIPADNHAGVCIGVIDLGTHMESYQAEPPKPVRKIKLQFELPGVTRDDGNAAIINATFNYSLHEKANFRKMLDGWLGADWPERNKGRSWEFLIGTPAMVNVEQGPSKRNPGQVVSWVQAVNKFPRGMQPPAVTRERFFLSLDAKHLPDQLSPYDAEKIRQSKEYRAGGFRDEAPRPDGAGGNGHGGAARTASNGAGYDAVRQSGRGAPAEVAPLLSKYNLGWPFGVDDLPDQVEDADLGVLNRFALPF